MGWHDALAELLRDASSVWAASWLILNALNCHILHRAPAGERVLLQKGTVLPGDLTILQPIHLRAEADVVLQGQLHLRGDGGHRFRRGDGGRGGGG